MNFYFLAKLGFVALSIIFLVLIFFGLKKGLKSFPPEKQRSVLNKFLAFTIIWTLIASVASILGFTQDFKSLPPRPLIFILVPLVFLIFILRSKTTSTLLQKIQPKQLLMIQSFRIFVEIFIWFLFLDNAAPIQMTFEGRNLDILVGLTAPIFAFICFSNGRYHRKLAIAWNIGGLLLLLNILIVAVLSMPTPFRYFMNEPANTVVGTFPVIFLPAILVPIAYYFHALSLKQLLMKPKF